MYTPTRYFVLCTLYSTSVHHSLTRVPHLPHGVALQNVSDLGDRPIDTRTYVLFDTVAAFHTGAPAVLMVL